MPQGLFGICTLNNQHKLRNMGFTKPRGCLHPLCLIGHVFIRLNKCILRALLNSLEHSFKHQGLTSSGVWGQASTVLIYMLWSSATAVASCPAGAEKLSANNQVARLPYTLFHCICSYHHSTFWQKNQENLSDKQTFLSTYSVTQRNTS